MTLYVNICTLCIRKVALSVILAVLLLPNLSTAFSTEEEGEEATTTTPNEDGHINAENLSSPSVSVTKSLMDSISLPIPIVELQLEEKQETEEIKDVFRDNTSSVVEILAIFDKDQDERLNLEEFGALCKNLFKNKDEQYQLENETLLRLFNIFDWNSNNFICKDEFEICHKEWIQKITHPVSVLVVVDVQNDFINGTLALKNGPSGQDGKEVVEPINELLDNVPFEYVFYTKDWHPASHISFVDNVQLYKLHDSSKIKDPKIAKVFDTVVFEGEHGKTIEQTLWPAHAIQDSWGSELDKDLKIVENSKVVYKGLEPGMDSYSAFLDYNKKPASPLKEYIDNVGAQDVYVSGLALDFCVGYTSLDSLDYGYRTVVVEDATRSINLEIAEDMKKRIVAKHGVLISKDKVKDMVLGIDRRPDLGLRLALTVQKMRLDALIRNSEQS